MPLHGVASAFNSSQESWTMYIERLGHYFDANDITDPAKKRSILLAVGGQEAFQVIRSLVDERELATKSYAEIVELVKSYYNPKPSIIVQRFNFNSRVRADDETIATYVAALRQIAESCDFKDTLSEMLRDRLVCGVNHTSIQRQLLAEKDLTYAKALELAQAYEAAEKSARELATATTTNTRTAEHAHVHYKSHSKELPRKKVTKGHKPSCYRCGGEHLQAVCKFKEAECYKCKKKGHIAKKCRSSTKSSSSNHFVESEETSYSMYTTKSEASADPLIIVIYMDGVPVEMEFDTGASLSIISESTYNKVLKSCRELERTNIKLKTYTGELIPVVGKITVNAKYENQEELLEVLVVKGNGPNLMGRDWSKKIKVNLDRVLIVNACGQENKMDVVLEKYQIVFKEELGCFNGGEVQLVVDETSPKFHKARPVPFVLKKKVETELDRLQELGIISPVQYSKWAAPVVPVIKQDGSVRLCGDFKVTINQVLRVESYPLPRVDELFANLAKGKYFSKLDLSQAYLQLPLAPKSREFVTINTSKGLFQYNRLPFGVSSAPAIFQRCMETLLQGCQGVSVYLDDILITGATLEEHIQNVEIVLSKLKEAGLRLKRDKCSFLQSKIEYLGHVIDAEGLHPSQEKINAIKHAPRPKNVSQLKSFLGMINYYSRFLPNLSAELAALYELLHKYHKWSWSKRQEQAFQAAKNALQSEAVLIHYDPSLPMVLACDASPYGIGAVLSHITEDGVDRPIAYASRTLTAAEKNYAQIEKEGLAIVFGTKKFHNYLYGRPFYIESDHQPLSFLFNESKTIPQMASGRIQRWALTLSAYQYSIRYKPGAKLSNADALSRLPRPVTTSSDMIPGDIIHLVNHLSGTSVNVECIKRWTRNDRVLTKVYNYVMKGWPENDKDPELQPYRLRKLELSVIDGCLLWGSRVIVPPRGQKQVLDELHEAHTGSCKMKALARSYLWWPKLDYDIEKKVRECLRCQQNRPSPSPAPVHSWEWPEQPWSRVHIDFAGPFMGCMFMVLVDAHSKWLECHIMSSITANKTIEKLRMIFSAHGLPKKIVSDNGPTFTSHEFKQFVEKNGIKHVTSAPYHPATNGLAERAVQTVKQGLKSIEGVSIQEKLSKLLFTYRLTPHSTTGVAPAEMLFSRRPRSRLDMLLPDIKERVKQKQEIQMQARNKGKVRVFREGDFVFVKDYRVSGPKWIPAQVLSPTGPLSYSILLSDGRTLRRHVDDIRHRCSTDDNQDMGLLMTPGASDYENLNEEELINEESTVNRDDTVNNEENEEPSTHEVDTQAPGRQSSRVRRTPNYFAPLITHYVSYV